MDAFKQKFVLADWKFANPKVDYAFKRIFGTEKYKDATINLLNSLLPHLHIVNVEYPNTELVGDTGDSRKACIDVLCTDNSGRQFIIEMQNAEQEHFFRGLSFTHHGSYRWPPRKEQVGITRCRQAMSSPSSTSRSRLSPAAGKTTRISSSITVIFFSLRNFDKKEAELETYPEKWVYLLKYSESFDEIPRAFKSDKTFDTFFEGAIRAGYSKEEEEQYVSAMMNQWDIENAKKFACDRAEAKGRAEGKAEGLAQGIAEGKAEGKAEMAKAMKSDGMPIDVIAKYSGLSEVEIYSL